MSDIPNHPSFKPFGEPGLDSDIVILSRIGVVGAGLAGLTLATILRQAGHQVIVIIIMIMALIVMTDSL